MNLVKCALFKWHNAVPAAPRNNLKTKLVRIVILLSQFFVLQIITLHAPTTMDL